MQYAEFPVRGCKASTLLCKGFWLAAAPLCCHQLHLQTLVTHINVYVPQIKPDCIAVHSGKFIINPQREGQWQQEDIHVNTQTHSTSSAQPQNEMIQEFKRHLLLCTYCMANVQGVSQTQRRWNLHHFLVLSVNY